MTGVDWWNVTQMEEKHAIAAKPMSSRASALRMDVGLQHVDMDAA